jgi:hypothetical protein
MSRFLRPGSKRRRTPREQPERRSSVWEDPERGGPFARLHELFSLAKPPSDPGKEIRLGEDGSPTLVTSKGEWVGVRAKDGSIIPAPKLPSNPAQWPDEMWDEGDVEWVLSSSGRWRQRWRL